MSSRITFDTENNGVRNRLLATKSSDKKKGDADSSSEETSEYPSLWRTLAIIFGILFVVVLVIVIVMAVNGNGKHHGHDDDDDDDSGSHLPACALTRTCKTILGMDDSVYADAQADARSLYANSLATGASVSIQSTDNGIVASHYGRRGDEGRGAMARSMLDRPKTPATLKRTPKKRQSQEDEWFSAFVGYWRLDVIDDYSWNAMVEFFVDEDGYKMKLYEGVNSHLREILDNDEFQAQNPISFVGDILNVDVLGEGSVRIFNTIESTADSLSPDDLTSTMRIQSSNSELAYMQAWTCWDGTGDSPLYGPGGIDNLMRYIKLPGPPLGLQRRDSPSPLDWTQPVNMFSYMAEYWNDKANPQQAASLHDMYYQSDERASGIFNMFLTTGVTRSAITSAAYRGTGFIGVWKTQFPDEYPITTLHTEDPHFFTFASDLIIIGFTGAYADLNGLHKVTTVVATSSSYRRPTEWARPESHEYHVSIDFDSSYISEPYDPSLHGRGNLTAIHGPVTNRIEYRNFVACAFDYLDSVFGISTHSRVRAWIDVNTNLVPETFAELAMLIAEENADLMTFRSRSYAERESTQFYWNPAKVGGSLIFPEVLLNDPFKLGLPLFNADPKFDYDIDLQNYIDPKTLKSVVFTITGGTDSEQPITEQLTDLGYASNGRKVVFASSKFGTLPVPLQDEFGVHPWAFYASADGSQDDFETHWNLAHGMIDSSYSCGKKIAYIRVGDEDGFDAPLYALSTRSLTFGRDDISERTKSNWLAAFATALKAVNSHDPDKYIIDLRPNGGGFVFACTAWTALFGGNRTAPITQKYHTSSGPGVSEPSLFYGVGIETVFNSVDATVDVETNVDEVMAAFPGAVVRGTAKKPKEVIILTSTYAASCGDVFLHQFGGSSEELKRHDLGHHVTARIVGDVDGRLYSGVKLYDGLPVSTPNGTHNLLTALGEARSAMYMSGEAGLLANNHFGKFINNPTLTTRPANLLTGWFDNTIWPDIGLIAPRQPYQLGTCIKPLPNWFDRSTWRDNWLESAIVD